jgi:hypothetical protein
MFCSFHASKCPVTATTRAVQLSMMLSKPLLDGNSKLIATVSKFFLFLVVCNVVNMQLCIETRLCMIFCTWLGVFSNACQHGTDSLISMVLVLAVPCLHVVLS